MTPQELKNSILQLAIQGKLVEQRAEEGTAEELYRQIQEEKKRLVKEGKIKKEKPLPEIAEEEVPFDIPESWMWVRLGEAIRYTIGKTPPRAEPEWWGFDVPWVSIADMPENGHITRTKESVSQCAITQKFLGAVVPAGTLLMSFKLTIGRVSILDVPAVHNEAIISIYPFVSDSHITQAYLFKILPLITQYGDTKSAIKGKTLNTTSISNLLLPLPPLAEQKRIVAKLEELLPYIDRYEQAWSKLEDFNKRFPVELQKSILQTAIQGKLVEQRNCEQIDFAYIKSRKNAAMEECDFDIPDTWCLGTLESICETIPTKQYQVLEKEVQSVGKYPVISQSKEYQIGFSDNDDRVCRVDEAIIAFGDHTTVVKYIDFDFIVGADGVKLFKPNGSIYFKYLFYALQRLTNGLNKIGGYSRHYKFIKNKPIPLPPLAEQKRIVAKLEELLPLCERLK